MAGCINNKPKIIYTSNPEYYGYEYKTGADDFVYTSEDGDEYLWNDMECIKCESALEGLNRYLTGVREPIFVLGNLGLWNKNVTVAGMFDYGTSAYDIVHSLKGSCDSFEVMELDGELYVNAYHHDGCNRYKLRALSSHGRTPYINAVKKKLSREEIVNRVCQNRNYLKRIRLSCWLHAENIRAGTKNTEE